MTGFVAEAFTSLRSYYLTRVEHSVAVVVETFIRDRLLAVGVFDGPISRNAWRRLRYVVAQTRSLATASQPTLRAFVDWMDGLQRARVPDEESPLADSDEDAVRVLTIHGAKGLEFPITILTGLSTSSSGLPSSVRVLPNRETGALDVKVGPFETHGFADAKAREDRLEAAEQISLFYVAATRARDHLVLSLFHGKKARNSAAARYRLGLARPEAPRWSSVSLDELPVPSLLARSEPQPTVVTPEEHAADEEQWSAKRAAAIGRSKVSPVVAATALGQVPTAINGIGKATIEAGSKSTEVESSRGVQPAASRLGDLLNDDNNNQRLDLDPDASPNSPTYDLAVRIDRAVHAALAEVGPGGTPSIDPAVEKAARENRVADEIGEVRWLVAAALDSVTVIASRSLRHWREVPLGVEVEGIVLAGRIDLVVQNADGTLRIIDYKTDSVDADTVIEHARNYRAQSGAYVLAIQEITCKRVAAVVTLTFAPLGGYDVTWDGVAALVAEARDRVRHRVDRAT